MEPSPARSDPTSGAYARWALAPAIVLPLALFLVGWKLFWFLTDDAFIAFRYVSNSVLGHGYVWNAAPFLPVEGYTSFLWVALLDLIWRVSGIEPPQAANPLALAFALFSFALIVRAVLRLQLPPAHERLRPLWLGLVLLACATNRSWLAWSSSGLETAMFNAWILAWTGAIVFARHWGPRQLAVTNAFALAIYLSRPDGLLFAVASGVIGLSALLEQRREARATGRTLIAFAPLLGVVIHLLWRHSFYGEWLPNTYYAKNTGVWWASSWRYLFSFIIEYAYWIVALVSALLTWRALRRCDRGHWQSPSSWLALLASPRGRLWLAVGTLLAHLCYYTFLIGGDHFEYRVYSYAVPVLAVAFAAISAQIVVRPRLALGLYLVWMACSWTVPWTHWVRSQKYTTREETVRFHQPVADVFPPPLRYVVQAFDDAQAWLSFHFVCLRHQEHKTFWREQLRNYPSRELGSTVGPDGFPVSRLGDVGYPGWAFPHVNIIDSFGLNDYLTARNVGHENEVRMMAHERRCPPIYWRSYSPNVRVSEARPVVFTRDEPLTADRISRLELDWRRWVREKRRIVAERGIDGWAAVSAEYLPRDAKGRESDEDPDEEF